MDEAYAYAYAPNGDLFLPFILVLRGADSEDDLSKYVFVLSFENYAPKLQNFWHIRKRINKKMAE